MLKWILLSHCGRPPRRGTETRIRSPVDVEIDDATDEFVSGPMATTEVSATASRTPAQKQKALDGQAPVEGDGKRLKVTTSARQEVDDRPDATSRSLEFGESNVGKKPRTTDDMISHLQSIDVWPDDERQQSMSCVVHGFVHKQDDMKILAMMLNGVDMSEVFSPARVVKMCEKYGLTGGESFDLRTGYDLSDPQVQARVIKYMQKEKPKLVIGSPPCTLFSRLQQLNLHVHGPEWAAEFAKRRIKAAEHISFCLKLFRLQRNRGDYFLFEHPESADSWQLPEVVEFLSSEGVMTTAVGQCMYGLTTRGPSPAEGELPAKKPTKFASNSWFIIQQLQTRCDGSHKHQPFVGGRAAKAAEYPDELCSAFCSGLAGQLAYDRSHRVYRRIGWSCSW